MDSDAILVSHLVELVDADHTGIGQDHGTSFKVKLALPDFSAAHKTKAGDDLQIPCPAGQKQ
jgi:hypothetical protein